MSDPVARFLAGAADDRRRIVAALWTRTLLNTIALNWSLLIRTYEGPGR